MSPSAVPSMATVDLGAIRDNVAILAGAASGSDVMAVVKGDGYGHGLVPAARAALAGGASWLGTAQVVEALALRSAGIDVPILAWIISPATDLTTPVRANIDLSASAPWAITAIAHAAVATGRRARVHLKIDTGMTRAGATWDEWPALVDAALAAQAEGHLSVVGIWSHLACADQPGDETTTQQIELFDAAIALAERHGLRPEIRHLANSAGVLLDPRTHYDLVRPGLSMFGLSPAPQIARTGTSEAWGLRPAMTLSADITVVKSVPAGTGVSYGHTESTDAPTDLAVVPLGYADGILRSASMRGPVQVRTRGGDRIWARCFGRVCMDQFVIVVGPTGAAPRVAVGDTAVLFGPGDYGEPTADDWADAAGTISYEIVARLGSRVPRRYVPAADPGAAPADSTGAQCPASMATIESENMGGEGLD